MKDLVEYIVKGIVNHPDDVQVDENNQGGEVYLVLNVNPEDMGIVIGKSGQTIKAIRKILTVRAMAENARVYLQLGEPNDGQRGDSKESLSDEAEG